MDPWVLCWSLDSIGLLCPIIDKKEMSGSLFLAMTGAAQAERFSRRKSRAVPHCYWCKRRRGCPIPRRTIFFSLDPLDLPILAYQRRTTKDSLFFSCLGQQSTRGEVSISCWYLLCVVVVIFVFVYYLTALCVPLYCCYTTGLRATKTWRLRVPLSHGFLPVASPIQHKIVSIWLATIVPDDEHR